MNVSLSEAARLAGVSKSTIFKAIKRGVLSASRDPANGQWAINVAELERVYVLGNAANGQENGELENRFLARKANAEWANERTQMEARIALLESERERLWALLQAESEERKNLVRLIPFSGSQGNVRERVHPVLWVMALVMAVLAVVAVLTWRNLWGS